MSASFVAPKFEEKNFNCPYCSAYAMQDWHELRSQKDFNGIAAELELHKLHCISHNKKENFTYPKSEMLVAICASCKKSSYWHDKKMVVPASSNVERPNLDMPDDCREIYSEASSVVNQSPRAAAALLRMCLEKLMVHLGETGKSLNDDIKNLVKKGLPDRIQKAADICRVIGNNSVHPGKIDVNETPEIARALFKLMNIIVEERISREKEINSMFDSLPESYLNNIAKRDGKNVT